MRQSIQITRSLAAILLLAASLSAQQVPKPITLPPLQAELLHLGAAAEAQILSLPNFTCEETATSQLIRNQKIRTNITVQGTVRVVRKPNGVFDETYAYKRPFHLLIIPRFLPYYVRGGFDSALTYFLPSAQPCYRYTLTPGRIDFATRTSPVSGHICTERGLTGYALLNPAGDVTHIQRTLPNDVAKPFKLASFASIDLAPVTLNGRTYLLSQHIIATEPLGNAEGHFEATYSNCKLFTSTVTIGPSSESPAANARR
ncbi:MAG: hypothetical protein WBY53_11100 [Acidobacteriaceae bacterium]